MNKAKPEPVQLYFAVLVPFMGLGLLVAFAGIAAEAWYGYTGAFEDALMACLIFWIIGMLGGVVVAEIRMPKWREETSKRD